MAKEDNDLLMQLGLPQDVLFADKHDLDTEFQNHPQNIFTVTEAIEDARLDRMRQETRLAGAEYKVRANLIETQDKKVLVKDLELAVLSDPEVRKQRRTLQDIEYMIGRLIGLLKSLEAKTSALKHLSELSQSGYYVTSTSRARPQRSRDG